MKILVIEDDEAVRTYLDKVLTEAGYQVLQAADGDEGIARISEDPEIAIVVTDLIMPEKDGIEAIIEIRKLRSGVKILAISGGGRIGPDFYLKNSMALGANAILAKPFTRSEFLNVIQSFSS